MIHQVLFLNAEDVEHCAPSPEKSVQLIEEVFCAHACGHTDQPPKPYVRPGGRIQERQRGRMISMPAYVGAPFHVMGIKVVSSRWDNPSKRGIPRASAVILLMDPDTGLPFAMMHGTYLSALRTAAAAMFAVNKLANDGPHHVALLGAGAIGKQIARAFVNAPITSSLCLYDTNADAAGQLCEALRHTSTLPISVASDPRLALSDAGIIVAATTAEGPYLQSAWFSPGSVYIAVSLVDADPSYMLEADRLVVDDWRQSVREEKPLARLAEKGLLREEDAFTFSQLASGVSVRRHPRERMYVNPMGIAIEDLAVAWATYHTATREGRGLILPWS
jgi:ornithine cyclodeaminase/alanine dehydrogenase-like protein (mu-crystallin family)